MKQILIGIWLCLVNVNCFSQAQLNFIDSLGRKQGHWIYFGKDRPDSGIPADGKVEEGDYINDRKEGTWIKYHEDGKTPKIKGEYENNRPKGKYTKTGPWGKLREEGTFEKNGWRDSLKRFYDNGQLEYEAWFNEDGKEHGRVNFYYENGQLELTYIANNGTPTESVSYDINGKLISTKRVCFSGDHDYKERITYVPDSKTEIIVSPKQPQSESKPPVLPENPNTKGLIFKPNGYNKIYNDEEEIWMDGEFVNGQLYNGKYYVYDRDGILLHVRVFKKGIYHSDGQI